MKKLFLIHIEKPIDYDSPQSMLVLADSENEARILCETNLDKDYLFEKKVVGKFINRELSFCRQIEITDKSEVIYIDILEG
jgi:hypothetical protein